MRPFFYKVRIAVAVIYVLSFALLSAQSAVAHPHLFVVAKYVVEFNEHGMSGINVYWQFDEMYSVGTVEAFDENGDGIFNPEEAEELARLGTEHLAQFSFFTNISVNNSVVPVKNIKDMQVGYENNQLIYTFFVPCSIPVGKEGVSIKISPYDPEYFAAMFFAETQPVGYQNAENFSIETRIYEDLDTAIFFDMIHPITLSMVVQKKG